MGIAAKKKKAAARKALSISLVEDSLIDEQSAQWQVVESGYWWVDAPEGRRLVADSTKGPIKVYNPLEVSGLFRELANVPNTEEGRQDFADRYGLLCEATPDFGEVSLTWWQSIESMSLAVTLWDLIETGKLSEYLRKERTDRPLQQTRSKGESDGGYWHLYRPSKPDSYWTSIRSSKTDPVAAARGGVKYLINEGLEGQMGLRIVWHARRSKYLPRITPHTLLGCMWWQFARLFLGEVEYVHCRVCTKLIERGKEAFMSTRVFCSSACKQKDHRQRVKAAKDLRAEGMSVARIAKKLDTGAKEITNWLTKKK